MTYFSLSIILPFNVNQQNHNREKMCYSNLDLKHNKVLKGKVRWKELFIVALTLPILRALRKPTSTTRSSINDETKITTSSTSLDYTMGSVPDIDEVKQCTPKKTIVTNILHREIASQCYGNYTLAVINVIE